MSSHVFNEIYLHVNWHAKNNHPLLTAKLEPLVRQRLKACTSRLKPTEDNKCYCSNTTS